MGALGHDEAHAGDEICGIEREKIGAGEVAVVMRVFFGAHHLGFATVIVPAAGGLDLGNASVELLGLALDFKMDGAADGGGGVEVFEFDFGTEGIAGVFAQGNVDVAAHLAFFHIGIGDATLDEDHLQGAEVGEGFLGGFEVGLADDFHEWGASAIEIDER